MTRSVTRNSATPHRRRPSATLYPPGRMVLRELGLRDGLQMTATWPDTATKTDYILQLYRAGVRHFEVGSFLPAARYPQFADIGELIDLVGTLPDAVSSALVLNERGMEDALKTAVHEIVIPVSATEEHSVANMRRTRTAAIDLVRTVAGMCRLQPRPPMISAAVAVAFGCSIAGDVTADDVVRLLEECAFAGADTLAIADTVGYAGPVQVAGLCRRLRDKFGEIPLKVHLHDTRGTGIANAHAALEAGIRILDGTVGGLGGCPFAPGASGNVVFEDLVFLCERSGLPTGIDLRGLISARRLLESSMPDEQLFGALARAGPPTAIGWQAG